MNLNISYNSTENLNISQYNVWIDSLNNLPKLTKHISFKKNPDNKNLNFQYILTDKDYITRLNNEYRDKDYETDVITFQYENDVHLENHVDAEIYICLDKATEQAKEHKIKIDEELIILAIHGTLHALGFDHERSKTEHNLMKKYETELLNLLNLAHLPSLTQ